GRSRGGGRGAAGDPATPATGPRGPAPPPPGAPPPPPPWPPDPPRTAGAGPLPPTSDASVTIQPSTKRIPGVAFAAFSTSAIGRIAVSATDRSNFLVAKSRSSVWTSEARTLPAVMKNTPPAPGVP